MRSVNLPKKKSQNSFPKKLASLLGVGLIVALVIAFVPHKQSAVSTKPATDFNKNKYSINDPSSIWAVVNKGRSLPSDYVPADLVAPNVPLRLSASDPEMQIRAEAASSLQQMFKDANDQNIHLMLSSGYRSYNLQRSLYNGYVNTQGQASADSSSAKAGHSEHQTGLALDVEPASKNCEVELCFADTPEGKWIAANAYKYGFIVRYQKGMENLSGYEYEPWHIRYVGVELAAQINKSKQTLEQFFGLPAVTTYPLNIYTLKIGA